MHITTLKIFHSLFSTGGLSGQLPKEKLHLEKMKVKGTEAQRLKVCVVANQLHALRGERSLGQLLGVCASALGCSVSLDAQHKCCLRNRAYAHKTNKKHPTNQKNCLHSSHFTLLMFSWWLMSVHFFFSWLLIDELCSCYRTEALYFSLLMKC